MTASLCDQLRRTVADLYDCWEGDEYHRIHTPSLYPDGDGIAVYVKQHGERVYVTDLGETVNWLLSATMARRLSRSQTSLLERIARIHGVDLAEDCFSEHVKADQLSHAVVRVSQAAARAADVSFTYKTRTKSDAPEIVSDMFVQHKINYESKPKVEARSGHVYTLDFQTLDQPMTSVVAVINPPSTPQRGPLYHAISAWSELRATPKWQNGSQFVTIFDDRMSSWSSSDYDSLRLFSYVYRLSECDRIIDQITAKTA